MSKIKVTPSEVRRLYIHPDTKQEFPSGVEVETDADWFVKAKLRLGHLVEVKGELDSESPAEIVVPVVALTIEEFEKLSAADQAKKLVALGLAADEKDDAISNKEKRIALYQTHLNGAGA